LFDIQLRGTSGFRSLSLSLFPSPSSLPHFAVCVFVLCLCVCDMCFIVCLFVCTRPFPCTIPSRSLFSFLFCFCCFLVIIILFFSCLYPLSFTLSSYFLSLSSLSTPPAYMYIITLTCIVLSILLLLYLLPTPCRVNRLALYMCCKIFCSCRLPLFVCSHQLLRPSHLAYPRVSLLNHRMHDLGIRHK